MSARQGLEASLAAALAALPQRPAGLLAGFSGGLDSSVLLHLLARLQVPGLRALHVHHGLQTQADTWALHCQQQCRHLGVPLIVEKVEVNAAGKGPEAAARHARHAAFARHMQPGEVLVLGHHLDDQAETFLLRALRGAGPDGLAAMRPWRAFPPGWLWRPLLETTRSQLLAEARRLGIDWVDDPSNQSLDFERNWLRQEIMPRLAQRLPQAARNLARAAHLQAQALPLLQQGDLACALPADTPYLPLAELRARPPAQAARLARQWIADRGLPPLPARGVDWLLAELASDANDRQSQLHWGGVCLRRWRDGLHPVLPYPALPDTLCLDWDGRQPLCLPNGLVWTLQGATGFDQVLQVRARQGGEKIRLPGRQHHHLLKHALQAAGIPPWQRPALPLLGTQEGTVLAFADILSAKMQGWLDTHKARLHLGFPGHGHHAR